MRDSLVFPQFVSLRPEPGFSVFVLWDLVVEQRNQGLASGCGLDAVIDHDVTGADHFPVEALVGVTVRSQRSAARSKAV
jgi:hypothetical protein